MPMPLKHAEQLAHERGVGQLQSKRIEAFVERSDLYNARTVLAYTASLDLMLLLLANGECVRVS